MTYWNMGDLCRVQLSGKWVTARVLDTSLINSRLWVKVGPIQGSISLWVRASELEEVRHSKHD